MKKLIQSSLFIAFGFFVSRILGLSRDLIVSARWGMTEQSDMVLFLINFPDLIVGMLMGSAVSALLVPQFVQSESEEDKRKLYSLGLQALGLYGVFIFILIITFSRELIALLAPGFDMATQLQAEQLLRWVSIAVLLSFIAGVPRAALLSKEYFKFTSFENLFFNFPLIIVLYFLVSHESYAYLGVAVMLAAGVRLLYLQLGAGRVGFKFNPERMSWNSSVMLRFLSLNVTSGCTIVLFLTLRALATTLGPGQLSVFSYFFKFLELPFGILTTIVFSIGLPRLSATVNIRHTKIILYILLFSMSVSLISYCAFFLLQGQSLSFFKVSASDIDLLLKTLAIGVLALPARLVMTYLQSLEYSKQSSRLSLVANVTALMCCLIAVFFIRSFIQISHLAWVLNAYYYLSALIMVFWAWAYNANERSAAAES